MPTDKPRITITMPEEQLEQVKEFQFSNKMKNQTQAILHLVELGFAELEKQSGETETKKETVSDERSAFIAALDNLPAEFWPMIVDLAKNIVANLEEKESKITGFHRGERKNMAAARSGDRMESAQVSKEDEDAALPQPYTGDI